MTRESAFKQRVRARMAATGESYTAARAHLDRGAGPVATLHVTNGESAAISLRQAGLDGQVLVWADVLHEGPVPAITPTRLRRVRAEFLAAKPEAFAARDRALEAAAKGSYVLWFEADLYDQLLLAQVVERLAGLAVDPARVTLVSIGEYRGVAHFGGLGELAPEALARLLPEGVALRAETCDLAREAWRAFTADRPRGLPAVARATSPELRFLGEAFARLMQEYPSRFDGLSLTERRILQAVEEGAGTRHQVFEQVWKRERRPYLGDASCFAIIDRLSRAAHPLLAPGGSEGALQLAPLGAEVLAGTADHVRLNGIDRWIGGVHLTGDPDWRYDERLETVTKGLT